MNNNAVKLFDILSGYAFASIVGTFFSMVIYDNDYFFYTLRPPYAENYGIITTLLFALVGMFLCYRYKNIMYMLFFSAVGTFIVGIFYSVNLSSPSRYLFLFFLVFFGLLGYFIWKKFSSHTLDIIIRVITVFAVPYAFITTLILHFGIG